MIIREMMPEDVKQVAAIEAQCFSLPWSEKSFLDSISRDDTVFLVAESESITEGATVPADRGHSSKIRGYIGMYISFEEGEITNVAVSLEYRNQGIGDALVTAIRSAGKEKKLERIVLEVRVSNTSALSLYKRKGFTELGIRKNFYEKPTEDAIIMACEI